MLKRYSSSRGRSAYIKYVAYRPKGAKENKKNVPDRERKPVEMKRDCPEDEEKKSFVEMAQYKAKKRWGKLAYMN